MPTPLTLTFWRRLAGGMLLLTAPLLGWAQQAADPPGRVAYVSAQEGTAQIAPDGRGQWMPAALNWPVTTGTRLASGIGSRTELHGGWTTLRLHGQSNLEVTQLDDDTLQVALTEGSLSARVRALQPGERVELDTPQLALVAEQPGEYRIDVDPREGTTRVTVHAGSAIVYGESGQSSRLDARQQISFSGRSLGVVQSGSAAYRDSFDQWVSARDALEDHSRSARYLSRDMPGYYQLDGHGEWAQDATYGNVWYPSVTVEDWAPYRYGQWAWVEPWGWTWIDDAPWGFAPSHYGRWTQIGPRWAWVPGPLAARPVYAPALVAFVGGSSGGTSWGISLGSGLPGAAWFPLAPGEYWEPHYHASDRYRRRLNDWGDRRERMRPPPDSFYFQRRPHAITVAPGDQFGPDRRDRRPRYSDGRRLPPGTLDASRVIAPPPRAYLPGTPAQAPLPRPGAGRDTLPRPDARPPRFGDEARPDVRPPRFEGGMRPDARPPRFEADARPDGRPPRVEGDARPPRFEGGARPGTRPPRFDGEARPGRAPDMRPAPGQEPRMGRERDRMMRDPGTSGTLPLPQRQPTDAAPQREQAPRQWQRPQPGAWQQPQSPQPGAQMPQAPMPRVQPMPQRPAEGMERGPRPFEPRAMPPAEMRQQPPRFEGGAGMSMPRAQPREREQFRAPPVRLREGDGG